MKGKIVGTEKLQKKLIALSVSSQISLSRDMAKLLVEMDADGKNNISSGSRSGVKYKRGKKTHIASATGEFPKTDTGGLISGFMFNVKTWGYKVVGKLENKAAHASAVEFKLKSEGGRPFMRPLYKKWKVIGMERFSLGLKQTITKVARG